MDARRVVVVGYDDAELLDIASVTTTLAMANGLGSGGAPYLTRLATLGGRALTCGTGLTVRGQDALETLRGPLDTLVVSGGWGHERAAANTLLTAHVRRLARESRRIASVCTGASVLAAAGLLDGRRATTHWQFARTLAERYPAVLVDADPIFVRDGPVATSAGVTSALDLTLSFVEEDHGPALAQLVARTLVTYLQRPGNQAQMSVHTLPDPEHVLVRRLVARVRADPGGDLRTAALAGELGVSTRQLNRLVARHAGCPPGRLVRRLRAETAAELLAATSLPVAEVARRCGFGSAETLRQVFVGRYGLAPSRYRAVHRRRPREAGSVTS